MVLKAWSTDQQYQHHLWTCPNVNFWALCPLRMTQRLWVGPSHLGLTCPLRYVLCILKFNMYPGPGRKETRDKKWKNHYVLKKRFEMAFLKKSVNLKIEKYKLSKWKNKENKGCRKINRISETCCRITSHLSTHI